MKITELIAKLQEILEEHGDIDVGYVDNGDFAENGGWTEPYPQVSDSGNKPKVVVL